MAIKAIGIMGSPREKGNTDVLVDEVLKGIKDAGGETSKFILNTMDISPCQGCYGCSDKGECVQFDDDMTILSETMNESQIFIFGTPVYWWGPTAQFKAFIDRWVSIPKDVFSNKKIILVIPLGASSMHYARHLTGMFEDIISYRAADLVETILAPGAGGKGNVAKESDLMKRAYDSGKNIVEKLSR